jgi:extracellular elastinolytic metalloproteinase
MPVTTKAHVWAGTLALACTAALAFGAESGASHREAWPGPEGRFDARLLDGAVDRRPGDAQREAVSRLRRELPDLAATFDARTGATWTLVNRTGFLTAAQAGREPLEIGLEFVRAHLDLFGLTEEDLAGAEVLNIVPSDVSGATYVHLRQRYAGIPVSNGRLHFGTTSDGRLILVNNAFVPRLAAAVETTSPGLDAAEAIRQAAPSLGPGAATARVVGEPDGPRQATTIGSAGLSAKPIEARLLLLPVGSGEVRLVWSFDVHSLDRRHVYEVTVDAADGRLWTRFDRVESDSYRVYAQPAESPQHVKPPLPLPPADGRTTLTDPAHAVASPYGWHDVDGVAGGEYTVTRGNNAYAYTDADDNDLPDAGSAPDGTATHDFQFPISLTQAPAASRGAAVTNLFYWTNLVHDVQYRYGFNEAAANFQVNNYGRGGTGNDEVQAEAQDGGGLSNANFYTPPEGERPRMQMYLWNYTAPQRDGDLDAGIIVHEYGHGISNRLVGGGTGGCLYNWQQPGEGLSDWWSLAYTAEPGDTGADPRGVGTYVLGQPVTGAGVRTQRYSTDPSVNTWTYASVNGMAVPHGVGSVWAQAYWEVYWKLVERWGFDPNLYDALGGAGNQRAMLYLNEGLKATACEPAFTQVRDGVISAATLLHGGEDLCRIWSAFAAFGLGSDAVSGGPDGLSPVNGFAIPETCRAPAPTGLTVTANGDRRIDLAWNAVPAATGYSVYRAIGACPQVSYTLVATGLPSPTFSDTTVSGQIPYSYVVTAQVDGIESLRSACASAAAPGPCTQAPVFDGLASVTRGSPTACALYLSWNPAPVACPGGVHFNVYRSTDPNFVPGPATLRQACVNGGAFWDTLVGAGATYHYVVRAEDSSSGSGGPCNGGRSDGNLTRRGTTADVPVTAFSDSLEQGQGSWVADDPGPGNPWRLLVTLNHSPTHSWFAPDPTFASDQRVAFAGPLTIPAGGVLSFWHIVDLEDYYDGGVLEYSTNGGATWFDILAGNGAGIPANSARFLLNGYNWTLGTCCTNPIGGRRAWSGLSDDYEFRETRVDLADFAGQPVRLRWRVGTDYVVGFGGWYLDDVTITGTQACVPVVPGVSVADVALAEGTGGARDAVLTVSLSTATTTPVGVAVATADGTAGPSDYTPRTATLSFPPGTAVQTVAVPLATDAAIELDETFTLNVTSATGATVTDGQGVATIVNDDFPVVSIGDATAPEGDTGASDAVLTLSLSEPAPFASAVGYAATGGTATAGVDFGAVAGTVGFPAGVTTRTVAVPVLGDRVAEAAETFLVTLSGPAGTTIGDGQAQGTILDDDAPGLTISDVVVRERVAPATASATFTVTLAPTTGGTVTVDWATADGTATAGGDYVAGGGTLTFDPGVSTQAVTVTVNADALPEGVESFTMGLAGAAGAPIAHGTGVARILDPPAGGDFNADSRNDLLWRHDGSGQNVLWYMNGADLVAGVFTTPSTLADPGWKIVGTGDFDANGRPDILWRHAASGENVLWFMNGSNLVAGTFLTPSALTDTRWGMAGTGDFNLDGRPDILWRHSSSGEIVVWFMNGSVLTSGTFLTPSAFTDVNWQTVGTGDFNLDGKTDILWRHALSGQNVVWYLEGTALVSGAFTNPPALVDTNWRMVATSDYNFDGRVDIVWRHSVSGQNVMWFMNGIDLISGTFTNPSSLPDTNWRIVGPR